MSRALQLLQPYVLNPLPIAPGPRAWASGLIGDHPSTYSRSPRIWNAAFSDLGLDAVYAPFDVDLEDLPGLVDAIRRESRFLGMNVTVPYKQAIIPLIDVVDERAARLDAVNTVVRMPDGELRGFNTDGYGALGSITRAWPGQPEPFLRSLDRAYLEPYSALAPATPPSIDDQEDEPEVARLQRWFATAAASIQENHALSMQFATRVPRHAAFFDLVYAPPETMTLRHARWSGHPSLNGQGMIVFQAVAAFVDHIARPLLEEAGFDASVREHVVETMALNWGT